MPASPIAPETLNGVVNPVPAPTIQQGAADGPPRTATLEVDPTTREEVTMSSEDPPMSSDGEDDPSNAQAAPVPLGSPARITGVHYRDDTPSSDRTHASRQAAVNARVNGRESPTRRPMTLARPTAGPGYTSRRIAASARAAPLQFGSLKAGPSSFTGEPGVTFRQQGEQLLPSLSSVRSTAAQEPLPAGAVQSQQAQLATNESGRASSSSSTTAFPLPSLDQDFRSRAAQYVAHRRALGVDASPTPTSTPPPPPPPPARGGDPSTDPFATRDPPPHMQSGVQQQGKARAPPSSSSSYFLAPPPPPPPSAMQFLEGDDLDVDMLALDDQSTPQPASAAFFATGGPAAPAELPWFSSTGLMKPTPATPEMTAQAAALSSIYARTLVQVEAFGSMEPINGMTPEEYVQGMGRGQRDFLGKQPGKAIGLIILSVGGRPASDFRAADLSAAAIDMLNFAIPDNDFQGTYIYTPRDGSAVGKPFPNTCVVYGLTDDVEAGTTAFRFVRYGGPRGLAAMVFAIPEPASPYVMCIAGLHTKKEEFIREKLHAWIDTSEGIHNIARGAIPDRRLEDVLKDLKKDLVIAYRDPDLPPNPDCLPTRLWFVSAKSARTLGPSNARDFATELRGIDLEVPSVGKGYLARFICGTCRDKTHTDAICPARAWSGTVPPPAPLPQQQQLAQPAPQAPAHPPAAFGRPQRRGRGRR